MTVTRLTGDRWDLITTLIGSEPRSVLDVGCRDRSLAARLAPGVAYTGLDLQAPADVIGDANSPLAFAADSFDCVVLADVLEHLERPQLALDEAMRVARQAVVVVLPNVYSLLHRLRFLLGRTMGKYEFSPEERRDRHRWLLNFDQASAFVDARARNSDWQVTLCGAHDHFATSPRVSARLAFGVARRIAGPNVWAWKYAARIEPAGRAPAPSDGAHPATHAAATI